MNDNDIFFETSWNTNDLENALVYCVAFTYENLSRLKELVKTSEFKRRFSDAICSTGLELLQDLVESMLNEEED